MYLSLHLKLWINRDQHKILRTFNAARLFKSLLQEKCALRIDRVKLPVIIEIERLKKFTLSAILLRDWIVYSLTLTYLRKNTQIVFCLREK